MKMYIYFRRGDLVMKIRYGKGMRRFSGFMLAAAVCLGLCLTGCRGPKTEKDAFSSESGTAEAGFTVPGEAALDEFSWAFNPASYDSGGEILFENPFSAAGIWEMAVWRSAKKGGAEKDIYWINITLEDRNGRKLDADPDVYAFQAFQNSEEAKNAGLQGSDTAAKLMEAMAGGDGSVTAHATVVLAGIEDNEGNWKRISAKPVQLEGKYYPERMFLMIEDRKGNEITANSFLTNGDEQHAIGAYTPAGNKAGLHGAIFLYRKIK